MKKIVIEAYTTGNDCIGPRYAKLLGSIELCNRLKKLTAMCVDYDLSEVRVFENPEAWGPGDIAVDLQLVCGELVVSKSAFWLVDRPRHSNYHIETRAQDTAVFIEAVLSEGNEPLFFGSNIDELKVCVLNDVDKDSLADGALAAYEFGDGVEHLGQSGWNTVGDELYAKIVFVRYDEDPADAPSRQLSFNVQFDINGNVDDAFALDMHSGNKVGHRGPLTFKVAL